MNQAVMTLQIFMKSIEIDNDRSQKYHNYKHLIMYCSVWQTNFSFSFHFIYLLLICLFCVWYLFVTFTFYPLYKPYLFHLFEYTHNTSN